MKNKSILTYTIPFAILLSLTPIASAHGEEESTGLSNSQVLIIASLAAIMLYFLTNKFLSNRQTAFSTPIIGLASFTGLVHVLLGIDDNTLLLGGIGALGLISLPMFLTLNEQKTKLVRLSLMILVLVMFVAYFVSNHDIHYILEDYLGLITKITELGILALLFRNLRTEIKTDAKGVGI